MSNCTRLLSIYTFLWANESNFGLESLDMPKLCRESMDMSLGPRPGKTAQKPLKNRSNLAWKTVQKSPQEMSGFLSKIWAVWAVFPKKNRPNRPNRLNRSNFAGKPLKPLISWAVFERDLDPGPDPNHIKLNTVLSFTVIEVLKSSRNVFRNKSFTTLAELTHAIKGMLSPFIIGST